MCDPETINARLDALRLLMDEREERTKERFAALDKAITTALATSDRAVTKAEVATEKRFEGINEFRETLSDQAATFMPRAEYDVRHKALSDLVGIIGNRVTVIESRTAGITSAVTESRVIHGDSSTRIIAIIGLAIALIVGLGGIIANVALMLR